MHNQAVKSNLVESCTDRNKVGSDEYKNHPLCPKPQRLPSAKPEFLKPLRCTKHRFDRITLTSHIPFSEISSDVFSFLPPSQPNTDEGSGILNMIARKVLGFMSSVCINKQNHHFEELN